MNIMKYFLLLTKYMFVGLIIVLSVAPFLWVFLSSFKSNMEIMVSSLSLASHFDLSNYEKAFKIAPLARFYLNSVIVAVCGTILNLFILGLSSYVIARFNFRGKNIIIGILSLSLLIPGAALLQPLYLTVKTLGLYDHLFGLILVYAGFGLPTSLFILSSFFLTIPKSLEESAYLDGAGFIKTFYRVILPLSKPGFSTAAVLQFLLCWNEFQFALTLTTGSKSRTLPLALYYFKSQFGSDYGVMFAATIIVIIPSIIVYMIMQEQVVSGLTAGAVKG
ncbi:carbohydrate ABC transporter permease [Paenibacillus sp. CGMCC 1.16610]|uniref:ABC transporter permease subunit n=2 Tax=Paenibacillus TaxID=44249 RepID=A0ABW9UJH7_9BACL|nr:carbohydrate ABC transporter permease [Paenibacillus sp. CGMCC 1.16610]MVQ39308.1 ABC transporter permease subunit [Paenibacillus anseongense]